MGKGKVLLIGGLQRLNLEELCLKSTGVPVISKGGPAVSCNEAAVKTRFVSRQDW